MTFEYNANPKYIKLENTFDFKCGDRIDGYNGLCKKDNYCNHLNKCEPIPYNPKRPITQHIPISYEKNYGYRICRSNMDKHCIRTDCKDSCENSKINIQ